MRSLLNELKRRKVFRVAVVYVLVAWVLTQVGDILLGNFGAPDWVFQSFVVLLALGFPLALVLTWAFELTPDGIQRDSVDAGRAADPASGAGRWGGVTIGALVLGGLAALGWTFFGPAPDEAALPPAPSAVGSVAVLPFDNFGNDREDYFSDGITEDIIAQLTRIQDLTVVSRTSSMRYRNTELTLPEIGRELSVGAILEGSVRRAEGRVRIVAQLVDVHTDHHLWAETYDREIEDIFAVQSEVAREIASALGRRLGRRSGEGADGAALAPTDPATYELYLRGRHLWHTRRVEAVYGAIEYFLRAIERDPEFALAHAALADAYVTLTFSDPSVATAEWVDLAVASVDRALVLNPDLGEAHAALGLASIVAWDWQAASEHLARALELTPGYVSGHHWYGVWMSALDRDDDAVRHLRRALELDPFSTRVHRDLGMAFVWAGRPGEAVEVLARGAELDPGFAEYYLTAWAAYTRVGRDGDAFEALLRAQELSPAGDLSADELRRTFRDEGLPAGVRLALARAPQMFGFGFYRAQFEVYVGDTDAALRSLEQAADDREGYAAWTAADPVVAEALGADPRYQALMKRLALPLR